MPVPETDRPDPVACLLVLGDACAHRLPAPPAVADWLTAAIKIYLAGDTDLDAALGLSAPDRWPARTKHRYARRNDHLSRACTLLGGDPQALAAALARFESVTWRRWYDLDSPPDGATAVQRELWSALQTGCRMPASPRHLRRLCSESGQTRAVFLSSDLAETTTTTTIATHEDKTE